MEISKEHIKLMKDCIGLKHKPIFGKKFKASQNRYFYLRCSLEQHKLWKDLCKIKYATFIYSNKVQNYYMLTENGIRFLELKYSILISL